MSDRRTRRVVSMSVCVPVTVKLIVSRSESDDEWQIDEVAGTACDPSRTTVIESMGDAEFRELEKRANAAKDLK